MSRRLSLTLLAVMALAAALVVPNMAPAATKKVRTKITIGHSGSRLTGKVKSRKATCRKGRRVVVYRGSRAVGRTKSSRRGKWHVNLGANAHGRFHAVAKKKKHRNLVCKAAKSRTITIGGGGGGGGTTTFSTK